MKILGIFRRLTQHSAGRGLLLRTGANRLTRAVAKASVTAAAVAAGIASTGTHHSQNECTKLDLRAVVQENHENLAKKNVGLLAQIRAQAINNFINGKEIISPELIKHCQEKFVVTVIASAWPNHAYRDKQAVVFTRMALSQMEQEIRAEYKKHFDMAMVLVAKQGAPRLAKASKELAVAYSQCQMHTFWFPSEMRCTAKARKEALPAFFDTLKVIESPNPLIAKAYADAQKAYIEQAYKSTIKELEDNDMVFRIFSIRT